MRSATLVTTLTSLTTAMAVAAPLVVFGFLYVLQVQPERVREIEAQNELQAALADLERRRTAAPSVTAEASAVDEFAARAARGERPDDLAGAFTALLNSPAVNGVSNLIVETDAPGRDGSRMTLAFDAPYEQVVRLIRSLRALPTSVDLQAVEIGSDVLSRTGPTHAKVSLLVAQVQDAPQPASRQAPASSSTPMNPAQTRDLTRGRGPDAAPQRDPVVSSILISDGRRVARVDGRIVGPGDRLAAGVVQSIEPDAIVIAGPDGRSRRLGIARPEIELRTR